jgi:hypothetical protein
MLVSVGFSGGFFEKAGEAYEVFRNESSQQAFW